MFLKMRPLVRRVRLIDTVLLPHTSWALLLLVPITFFGFYPSYYSTFRAPGIIHIHGAFMALWLTTALVQIWLITTHNHKWHKLTGRFSYFLMPAILLSGYFVLRHGYNQVLEGRIVAPPEYYPQEAGAVTKAADFVVIGSVYFVWLLMYYGLGIYFRRRMQAHATFMLAATLTILGPSGDRLIGHICDGLGWEFNTMAEYFTIGVVFFVFLALLLFHYRRKLQLWPAMTVLVLQTLGTVLLYHLPFHPVWDKVAAFLFQNNQTTMP